MNNLSQNNFLLMCFSKESELRSLSAFATHFASLTRLLSTDFKSISSDLVFGVSYSSLFGAEITLIK